MTIISLCEVKATRENPLVVFKYKLGELNSMCSIHLPINANLTSVGFDPQGELSLWAETLFKEQEITEEHVFLVIGTGIGYELPSGEYTKFIGTAHQGACVFHVFEILKETL